MTASERLSRLFLQQRNTLLGYIHALVRDASVAEDIFQDVGVQVLSKGEGPEGVDFAAWCRGIARNLVLHYWRSQRRCPVIPSGRLLDAFDRAYEEAGASAEAPEARLQALADCMQQLPERSRGLLDMRYFQGSNSTQIGLHMHRSADAIRKLLARIRKQLADCVRTRQALGINGVNDGK